MADIKVSTMIPARKHRELSALARAHKVTIGTLAREAVLRSIPHFKADPAALAVLPRDGRSKAIPPEA